MILVWQSNEPARSLSMAAVEGRCDAPASLRYDLGWTAKLPRVMALEAPGLVIPPKEKVKGKAA